MSTTVGLLPPLDPDKARWIWLEYDTRNGDDGPLFRGRIPFAAPVGFKPPPVIVFHRPLGRSHTTADAYLRDEDGVYRQPAGTLHFAAFPLPETPL